jgi:hypothetical protein
MGKDPPVPILKETMKKTVIIIILCSLFLTGCTSQEKEIIEIESLPTSLPIKNSVKDNGEKAIPTKNKYVCDCSKTCNQITDCDEAYYQLNNCGCSKRDGDKDGIPCEDICL